MAIENKREVVERLTSLMDVAETLLQEKAGAINRDEMMNSRLFASIIGNLINSDPILYDLLEGEEEE